MPMGVKSKTSENENVFKYLMMAIEVYETCLGIDHPDTAEAYTKLALAYKENGMMVIILEFFVIINVE